ncbi:P44/Msp2 family outer membrane protein [Wolbachia endosymbiont of Pentidionis agamae]|uniref:P44/Msp2 family outer membrane protein n=1 Tax=Wolbachia endosymbiont of Pentidionis agamae TaxID=3110435 RepID=UPI002FD3C945
MLTKKMFIATAVALLISHQSFAEKNIYISGSYHNEFFNSTGEIKVKDSDKTWYVNDFNSQDTKAQELTKYKPSYSPPFAASLALGYKKEIKDNDYRFELEFARSSIRVHNRGLTDGPIKITDSADGKEGIFILKDNDEVKSSSLMVSAYREWKNERFSPYAGAGVGVARITQFNITDSFNPAIQLKAGINYFSHKNTDVYFGYRYFRTIGSSEFITKTGTVTQENEKDVFKENINTEILTVNSYGMHALEVGVRIHL